MDFIFKNISVVCKVLFTLIIIFILIRIIPLLVAVGIAAFVFYKAGGYFKSKKRNKSKKKNMDNIEKNEENPFGIGNEKIIDVDYDEIKK
ncbi:hypothetical protein ACYUJ6_11055 [Clostridium sp. JNZ X4-2]